MRLAAIIPILLCIGSLVLSFLVIFAGYKKGFMEDYQVLTLNTSQIGSQLFNLSALAIDAPTQTSDPDDPEATETSTLTSLIKNITSAAGDDIRNPTDTLQGELSDLTKNITSAIQDELNGQLTSWAHALGLPDFYALHMTTLCNGSYTPAAVSNATLPFSAIHQNTTYCTPSHAGLLIDPGAELNASLADSGLGITLEDLGWPAAIDDGIRAFRTAMKAAFVLYCIGIAFTFICLVGSVVAVFTSSKVIALLDSLIALMAFIMLGVASAIMTAIAVKGAHVVNKYGSRIGVRGERGGNFLVITWVAVGVMFVVSVGWCLGCCLPGRRDRRARKGAKR
ncbi:hypothetical protein K402DRAFT_390691 [Aulographum hederae CBS 113979]|uniref:Integral membrane protein-like protein n=1 Tax=Aulographum hederae CBS 113979 TaxID=1176131 RepID=A0A6G1H915_9PEZI|nr:hypothetical protein K402DRAFT_390691 [Aulographum hederae CBS 113979]